MFVQACIVCGFAGPFFVIYISRLSSLYCLVCSLQPSDHLLGKGLPLRSLVHNVFLCFVIFHMLSRVRCGT